MYALGPVESSNAIRPNKQRVVLRVLVIVGSLLPCAGAFGQWVVETVDAEGDVGKHCSIAVFPDGSVGIACHDETNGDLKFAKRPPSADPAWEIEVAMDGSAIGADVGEFCSLAIAPDGTAGVSHVDRTHRKLYVSEKAPAGSWNHPGVQDDPGHPVLNYPTSLARGPSGWFVAYVEYYRAWMSDLERLRVRDQSQGWAYIYAGAGFRSYNETERSLTVLPSGHPAIAYRYLPFDNPHFGYAWRTEQGWSGVDIGYMNGGSASLAVAPSGLRGLVHDAISYRISYNDSTWQSQPGPSGTTPVRLAYDPAGTPFIAHRRGNYPAVSQRVGDQWVTETIAEEACSAISLALLPDGTPVVAYYATAQADLKFAFRSGRKVTNVVAGEHPPASGMVRVSYDLAIQGYDSDPTATVSLQVSPDGGQTWMPVESVSGDIGPGITPGTGRQITWNAGADIPCQFGDQFVARVAADGPFADSVAFTIWAGKVVVKTPDLPVPRGGEAEITATLKLRCDECDVSCGISPGAYTLSASVVAPDEIIRFPQGQEIDCDPCSCTFALPIDLGDPLGVYSAIISVGGPDSVFPGLSHFTVDVVGVIEIAIGTVSETGEFARKYEFTPGEEVSVQLKSDHPVGQVTVKEYALINEAGEPYEVDANDYLAQQQAVTLDAAAQTKVVPFHALPVLDDVPHIAYARHKIEVYAGQARLRNTAFADGKDTYNVPGPERDCLSLLILTDPEQLATEVGGASARLWEVCPSVFRGVHSSALVYDKGDPPVFIRARLRRIWQAAAPPFLLILGGGDVIPHARAGSGVQSGLGDHYYWDLEGDLAPNFAYGRVPTVKTQQNSQNALMSYLHRQMSATDEPALDRALLLWGRDALETYYHPMIDPRNVVMRNALRHAEEVLIRHDTEYQYHSMVSEPASSPGYGSDPQGTVKSAGLIWALGHGDNYRLITCNGGAELLAAYDCGGICPIRVHTGSLPSSYDSIFVSSLDGQPYVYLGACKTAGQTDGLAETIMYSGATCCAAFGISSEIVWARDFGLTFADLALSGGLHVGDLHRSVVDRMRRHIATEINQLPHMIHWNPTAEPEGFVLFGNPARSANLNSSDRGNLRGLADTPTTLQANIIDYALEPAGGETVSIRFMMQIDGTVHGSQDWLLKGNPVVPYVETEFSLLSCETLVDVSWTSETRALEPATIVDLNDSNLPDLPGYPLDLPTYFSSPVMSSLHKEPDGAFTLTVRIFPFQYTPATGELTMHDNLRATFGYQDRTASISSAAFVDEAVKLGADAELAVASMGGCELHVIVDHDPSTQQVQHGAGTNTFVIPTNGSAPGSHSAEIKCYVGDALDDETARSFTVVDKRLSFAGPAARESVVPGVPLRVAWEITNEGIGPEEVSQVLEVYSGDETMNVNRGTASLDVGSRRTMAFDLATSELKPGVTSLRTKATVRGESVYSPFHHVVVVPRPIPEDADWDADVDFEDFSHLQECFTGADSGPPAEICKDADYDADGDIDLADYELLNSTFGGPGPLELLARVRRHRDAYEGNIVCLDGRRSTSGIGRDIVAYEWQQAAGPFVELVDADGPTPSFTAPPLDTACSMTLKFALRVHDGYEWSDWSRSEVVTVRMGCDANHDGVCDQGDWDFIIAHWVTNCAEDACLCDLEGDLDGNGNVGLADVLQVIAELGRSCVE